MECHRSWDVTVTRQVTTERPPPLTLPLEASPVGCRDWLPSLKLTANAPDVPPPKNSIFQPLIFRGELLVSGRVSFFVYDSSFKKNIQNSEQKEGENQVSPKQKNAPQKKK